MHIGLIGGIGVAATLQYYARLTRAIEARGRTPDITISHAHAGTLVANNRADDRQAQAEIYRHHLDRLAAAGAEVAAITSLGGHFCFAETEAVSPLPLISGIAPIDIHLAREGIGKIGLLGTTSAMKTALYGQLKTPTVRPEDTQAVGRTYEEMALRGAASDTDEAVFLSAGRALAAAGADAVLLAGTDLGLVFDHVQAPFPVIDALDIHVAHLASLAGD